MNAITVLLCDDHDVVRQGLRALLGAAGDMQVVGEAENGHRSIAEAKRLCPNVILLDLAMPQLNGVEAIRQITNAVPSARVLILSSHIDEQSVQQAIEAGAAGYVTKVAAASEVCQAIREVHKGQAFFSPLISRLLLQLWRHTHLRSPPILPCKLTSREMEVLQLIAEGHCNKQIAALLWLSNKTVQKHRQTLMDKLRIHKIASLTRYAAARGVVELSNPYPTPIRSKNRHLANKHVTVLPGPCEEGRLTNTARDNPWENHVRAETESRERPSPQPTLANA